jgi:hypothetical protein
LSHVLEQRGIEPSDDAGGWRRPNRVLVMGVLVVAAATATRLWLMDRTWFHLDDLILTNTAAREPLSLHSLTEPYFGHLMPAGRLLAWLAVQGEPYDYTWAVVELGVLTGATGVAMLHLLVTLFGRRPGVLVPLTYFMFSPFVIPSTLWWSVGINHLPALSATCMATAALVRHLRTGDRRTLVSMLAWLVVGLLFAELTALAAIPMALIGLGYFAKGTLGQRIDGLWAQHRDAVVSLAGLGLAYLAIYWTAAWGTAPVSAAIDWSRFITNASLLTAPVAAVGGPGAWHVAWAAQLEEAPGPVLRLVSYVILVVVVSASTLTRDRAARAWLLPLAQLAVCTALVAKTRVLLGPGIALDPRFFTPLALGIALALGLAFLPVVDAVETVERRRPHWLADRPVWVALALAGFVTASLHSAATYPLRHLGSDDPESFYAALRTSLDEHDAPVDLVNATVPTFVLGQPEAQYRRALAQFGDLVRFPLVVQDDYYVVDASGRLVRPELAPARQAAGPAPSRCGFPVSGQATIPLDGPVIGYGWRLRIAYSAEAATSATVSVGDVDTPVDLLAGDHVVEMPGDAAYDAVAFTGVGPDAGLCVASVTVGTTQIPQ